MATLDNTVPISKANWETIFTNGGNGTVKCNETIVTMQKSTSFGFVAAQYRQSFTVEKGQEYYAFCEYQTNDALQSSILMLKMLANKNRDFKFCEIDGGRWLWPQYYTVRNTPDDVWDSRYTTFTAEKTEELFLTAVMWGNPFTTRIKNIQLHKMPAPSVPVPIEYYKNSYTKEQVDKHLQTRQNTEAVIKDYNGRKAVLINGKLDSVGLYKGLGSRGPNQGLDIAHFGEIGINTVIRNLPTGKIDNNDPYGFWIGQKKYDFQRIDENIYDTLQKNPDANIILDICIRPYPGCGNKHSMSEIYVNSKGEYAYGPSLHDKWTSDKNVVDASGSGKFWIPSWASPLFLNDLCEMLTDVLSYIKTKPYYKTIIGTHFTGGDDGQFGARQPDHATCNKTAYRNYLKLKYGSIENLNKQWDKSYSSFNDLSVPEEVDLNLDSFTKASYITADYNDFKLQHSYAFRDKLAQIVKKNIGKQIICTSYGYPRGDHFAKNKNIDAHCFQPGYPSRKVGVPTVNFPRTLSHRSDKAYIAEFDTRGLPDVAPNNCQFYFEGVGGEPDMKLWVNAYRKLIGQMITKGYLHWYYDMNQFYNTPQFRTEIKKNETILKKIYNKPKTRFKPDVCVVMSNQQHDFCNNWRLLTEHINYNPQFQEFELSGVPMDKVNISEMQEYPELRDYKVLIFFQDTYFSNKDREFIEQVLKKGDRTLIWVYHPGYITEQKPINKQKADKLFSKLIGMNVVYDKAEHSLTPYYLQDASYMNGTPETFCGTKWLSTILSIDIPYGETFRINDDTIEVIARYKEDNTVAGAVKKYRDWTSIYLATPQSLHGTIVNNIAQDKGCYVAAQYGQQIDIDGDFASVHGIRAQEKYTINLPEGKNRIYDAVTGKLLADNVKEYSFSIKVWETYWFTFE